MSSAIARKLESLGEKGVKQREVALLLKIRPEQVSRWKSGHAYPHSSTERALLELEFVVDQLSEFYEPNAARQWLFTPQRLLNGVSPADLIQDGKIDEVRRLVNQLREGVYL